MHLCAQARACTLCSNCPSSTTQTPSSSWFILGPASLLYEESSANSSSQNVALAHLWPNNRTRHTCSLKEPLIPDARAKDRTGFSVTGLPTPHYSKWRGLAAQNLENNLRHHLNRGQSEKINRADSRSSPFRTSLRAHISFEPTLQGAQSTRKLRAGIQNQTTQKYCKACALCEPKIPICATRNQTSTWILDQKGPQQEMAPTRNTSFRPHKMNPHTTIHTTTQKMVQVTAHHCWFPSYLVVPLVLFCKDKRWFK